MAALMKCVRCDGAGRLRIDEPECNGGLTSEECERCKGVGWVRIVFLYDQLDDRDPAARD